MTSAAERSLVVEDIDALVDFVGGINVKLAKCGGIAAAKVLQCPIELIAQTIIDRPRVFPTPPEPQQIWPPLWPVPKRPRPDKP